jgi:ribonuclease-3
MHRGSPPHNDTTVLETKVGYCFHDGRLLDLALTHPAYRHEHHEAEGDFERLEFLGDAVLSLLLADQLYRQRDEADEGTLTVLRSQCASGRALSEIAREIGLDAFLKLGKGDVIPAQSQLPRYLAAALEALLGAAWLDGGLDAAGAIYARLFKARVAALERDPWADNPKGELQALMQAHERSLPVYDVVSVEGPPHAPRYRVTVTADETQAVGEGHSKQSAETSAAQAWLDAYDDTVDS